MYQEWETILQDDYLAMNFLYYIVNVIHRTIRRGACFVSRSAFSVCGKNVVFDPLNSTFSYSTIEIGCNVFIGGRAWFSCAFGKIKIGSNVMFGPNVMILGGNHRFQALGMLMYEDSKKVQGDDRGVIVEDDVWVGANTIILEGVKIGTGSVIGAGSVVTKSTPPYSISVGVPARVVSMRFREDELKLHTTILKNNDNMNRA